MARSPWIDDHGSMQALFERCEIPPSANGMLHAVDNVIFGKTSLDLVAVTTLNACLIWILNGFSVHSFVSLLYMASLESCLGC